MAYLSTKLEVMALKSVAFILTVQILFLFGCGVCDDTPKAKVLRFNSDTGKFKILQVADMHYANGATTACRDVTVLQFPHCSDLNTTAFLRRMIRAENPDLIVFTGDNIYGDASDAKTSMNAAFAPAIESNIPWAAVLGNHDQESNLNRKDVMKHIVTLKNTLSKYNPLDIDFAIDGYGNYNLEVVGARGSHMEDKNVVNLYFLDSGDYSTDPSIQGYGWIKASQKKWFKKTSSRLRKESKSSVGMAFFHIPLPEYANISVPEMTGVKQDPISSAKVNSKFFRTMKRAGDVKAVFVGHDHLNDFCGQLSGVSLCYAGGFGYHAYGKAGWARRSRVMEIELGKEDEGGATAWGSVAAIKTWKRLDDKRFTKIDEQTLWTGKERVHGKF